jgi:MFS family permease
MALDNLARAGLVAVVPALHWAGLLHVWQVMLVASACGLLSPITEVGESALVPELVADEELEEANSLISANWEVAALVGPLGAGVLIELVGAPATLLVDSASFLAMAAVMLTVPSLEREGDAGDPVSAPGALRDTLEGFALLVKIKAVGLLTLVTLGILFLEGVREVLVPVYGREVLGSGASGYGFMLSAIGAGSLLGLAVSGPLVRKVSPGAALAGVLVLGGVLFVPLAFVRSLPAALAVVFVAGFALAPFYVVSRSARQRLVPRSLRGRVFGAGASLGAAGFPLGSAAGGFLLVGLSTEVVIVLWSVLVGALGMAALSVPELRESPDRSSTTGKVNDSSRPARG